eukprot:TRINITY_DN6076_c0_g1_i1.p1 TRINITY_DN6076_c0_g1~~TRINITY_DN6076_c0_g1_i1.p1  ORF type:complete len:434 (-),score=73.26 TRINITY_DN6076_c0_g1_i1:297-1598(-)
MQDSGDRHVQGEPPRKRQRQAAEAWAGTERVKLNVGGTTVETTRHTLGLLGTNFLTHSGDVANDETIFLDFPIEAFKVLQVALLAARASLRKAILVIQEALEDQWGPAVEALLSFLGLEWISGTVCPMPIDWDWDAKGAWKQEKDHPPRFEWIPGGGSEWGLVMYPTKDSCRILPQGVLSFMASNGALPRAYDGKAAGQKNAATAAICCSSEREFMEELGEQYLDGPSLCIRRIARVVEFHSQFISSDELQSRWIFDVGKGRALLLTGFALVMHACGPGAYPVQVDLRAEASSDLSPSVASGASAAQLRRQRLVMKAAGVPRGGGELCCGPKTILSNNLGAETSCRPDELLFSRMFALTVKCHLKEKEALVFREIELYGTLIDVPAEVLPTQLRSTYAFDAASEKLHAQDEAATIVYQDAFEDLPLEDGDSEL